MPTITAIEIQKRRPDRVNVHLDGQYGFGLASILAARLKVGQDLELQSIAELQEADACEQAYQLALRFLSYRRRSEAELRQHLHRHRTADDVVEKTILRLRDNHLADDSHFARAWIENRNTFRPRGRRALAWELSRKGIPTETAQSVLAEVDEPAMALQAASKRARRLAVLPWIEFRGKLSAFLARRGFDSSVIAPVVAQLWSDTHCVQTPPDNEDTP